jgi:radical SAM-linked protein
MEFAKHGVLRYLSHLGLARMVQRLFRRAGVPLAFSQGHAPHPRIQFGPPLPLGYEADAEYLDFETTELVDVPALLGRLAAAAPDGFDVRRLVPLPARSRALFDVVTLQIYRVVLPKERLPGPAPGELLLGKMMSSPELLVQRERDGVVRTRDVRPLLAGAELVGETADEIELLIRLRRVGDTGARPDEVIRAAGGFPAGEECWWRITRTANLVERENTWHTPTDLPEEPPQAPSRTASSRR